MSGQPAGRCGICRHFTNDAAVIESRLPAMCALSSAYGTSRGEAGFCDLRDLYLAPECGCAEFSLRP